MKCLIIIEDEGFLVSEKEQKILSKLNDEINKASYPKSEDLIYELDKYLTENKPKYKPLGSVMFDFRI